MIIPAGQMQGGDPRLSYFDMNSWSRKGAIGVTGNVGAGNGGGLRGLGFMILDVGGAYGNIGSSGTATPDYSGCWAKGQQWRLITTNGGKLSLTTLKYAYDSANGYGAMVVNGSGVEVYYGNVGGYDGALKFYLKEGEFYTDLNQVTCKGASASSTPRIRSSTDCPACPTNCRTETKKQTYFARPQKLSETDIPIVMNKKIVKCENTTSAPQQSCAAELQKLKGGGMSGLGCTSCNNNAYNNRM